MDHKMAMLCATTTPKCESQNDEEVHNNSTENRTMHTRSLAKNAKLLASFYGKRKQIKKTATSDRKLQ